MPPLQTCHQGNPQVLLTQKDQSCPGQRYVGPLVARLGASEGPEKTMGVKSGLARKSGGPFCCIVANPHDCEANL